VHDLISQPISIAAFDKVKVEWVLNTTELLPNDISTEQRYEYSVILKRGEIERKIIVNINPLAYPPKLAPAPPR